MNWASNNENIQVVKIKCDKNKHWYKPDKSRQDCFFSFKSTVQFMKKRRDVVLNNNFFQFHILWSRCLKKYAQVYNFDTSSISFNFMPQFIQLSLSLSLALQVFSLASETFSCATSELLTWCESRVHPFRPCTRLESFLSLLVASPVSVSDKT